MQDRKLTLLIPGFLGPKDLKKISGALDELDVLGLEMFLSRADRSSTVKGGFAEVLFSLFGIHASENKDLPVAALTHMVDGEDRREGYWFRADPVHLKADRDRIVMFGNRPLNVTQAEANQLADEFNKLFAEDGVYLETPTTNRWYLRVDNVPKITTEPLANVIGQDIHPLLPKGDDALFWHKLLNEVQMLFHTSIVNQQREMNRQPTINSFWLWGGGELPESKPVTWHGVWSNETLATALATYFNVEHGSAAASAEDLFDHIESGEHLVVLEGAIEAVQFQDIGAWRQFVEGVSTEWISPLLNALKKGELAELRVVTTEGHSYSLNAKQLRRWWKRPRYIANFMQ